MAILNSNHLTGRRKNGRDLSLVRPLSFDLPADLEASEPPEVRGLARDQVRLMVSHYKDDRVSHACFRELDQFLDPGDVLVINTSGTMNAALPALRADGRRLELRLSTRLPTGFWSVELRQIQGTSNRPFLEGKAGEWLALPEGGRVNLLAPYAQSGPEAAATGVRLWVAALSVPEPLSDYLRRAAFPIRYNYVKEEWPLSYYQTVYATETGSSEIPSAGRAFTPELITNLVARGVQIAPLLLHTGVASLEAHEPPYEEYYRLPATTAETVNQARAAGRRVVAVGTTTVRALETATNEDRVTSPGEGWTDLVITPDRVCRAVTGILTGFHEPAATHLSLLQAFAGRHHLELTYAKALERRYLWHEFGDLHLILP